MINAIWFSTNISRIWTLGKFLSSHTRQWIAKTWKAYQGIWSVQCCCWTVGISNSLFSWIIFFCWSLSRILRAIRLARIPPTAALVIHHVWNWYLWAPTTNAFRAVLTAGCRRWISKLPFSSRPYPIRESTIVPRPFKLQGYTRML